MRSVLYERKDGIGVVTLNQPERMNSMSEDLLRAFDAAVGEAREDRELRCLVVTGAGKAFSTGADLRTGTLQREDDERLPHERSFGMYEPFLRLLEIEVPVIGALNGHAVGGGFGLALACDLRVANEDAKYGVNFVRLGLHPGMAVTYLLPRLVGLAVASDWLYTGRLFDGREGAGRGVFNEALPGARVLERAMEIAHDISLSAPIAVRMTKRTVRRQLGWDPKHGALEEAYAQAITLETEDAREALAARLEKRPPRFRGR